MAQRDTNSFIVAFQGLLSRRMRDVTADLGTKAEDCLARILRYVEKHIVTQRNVTSVSIGGPSRAPLRCAGAYGSEEGNLFRLGSQR